ncbi:MAG: arylsulfotransferase family protein [Nitrospirota bacterium]
MYAPSLTDKDKNDIAISKINSLPYLQGYFQAPKGQKVTIYKPDMAYQGFNLYCSGHRTEAGIMDMEGNILHTWHKDINEVWPGKYRGINTTHWRRVHLLDNGELLAIFENIGLIKLDKNSNLLWKFEGRAHHHLQLDEEGNIYVLTRKKKRIARIRKGKDIYEEFITVLDPEGHVLREISLLESFENSQYSNWLNYLKINPNEDIFHTNTIQLFDGSLESRSNLFKKGNVLVSVRNINTIAIIDMDDNRVIWAQDGIENNLWIQMHEPVLLDNGHILIFDNLGNTNGYGRSKVIEFDPLNKEIFWQYSGTKEKPFESPTCGTNQRLPNGNTLITETDYGRAFEVTMEGKIVWEYISPHRAGKDNEFIATLLHLHRIEPDLIPWLIKSDT